MKTVLITGSSGYIGSQLSLKLANLNIKVYAIARQTSIEKIPKHPNIVPIICDLKQIDLLPTLIDESVDTFYHFAWGNAYSTNTTGWSPQLENILFSCKAANIAKQLGCRRFIYPNTVMAYSSIAQVSQDKIKPDTRNYYYIAKETAHIMLKTLCSSIDLEYIEVPITNIYGPNMTNPTFFDYLLKTLLTNSKCIIKTSDSYYDFMFITDATHALYLIGEYGKPYCSYYLGSECPKTIKQYVLQMKEILNSTSEICFNNNNESIGMNPSLFNIHRLSEDLNFKQSVDFETGVKKCKKTLELTINSPKI